jgi:2-keto-4-pentenoate hydratase/2-oxohepta-3-ene-1,7-dioic acid hydratase in catechol pathway
MLGAMRIYRYRIGRSIYYGEQVSETTLERCVRPNPQKFELHRAGAQDQLDAIELLVPTAAGKIVCVGRNYADHAAELGNAPPEERPLLFLKPPSCLIPHGEPIVLPKGYERVDYEGEIALLISQRCSHVTAEQAHDYLLGVTAFNDVTERTWQKRDGQWTVAKGCDTFGPCGPYIDTGPAEALRLGGERRVGLAVTTRVNGEQRQHGLVRDLLFSFASLISYISQYITLDAGDLIATGTPAGVGALRPGDEVAVELNCGPRLVNPVVTFSDTPMPPAVGVN